MIDVTRDFYLNVSFKKGTFFSDEKIILVEKDNKSTKFIFKFEEDINNRYVRLKFKNYLGNVKEKILSVQNSKAELLLTRDVLNIGKIKMSISLIGNDNETLTIAEYLDNIEVKENLGVGENLGEDILGQVIPDLEQIREELEGLDEKISEIEVPTKLSELENDVFEEISDFEVDKMFQPRTFCRVDLENASVVSSMNEADGDYFTRGTEITVKANEAPEGYVVDFLEVIDKHNHIKYSDAQYKFSVEEDTMIKAVYAKEGEVGEPLISVTLQQSAGVYGSHGDTIFLSARRNTFKPYVVNEWGILRTFGDEELTLENANANENITKRAAKVSDTWYRNILPISMSLADYIGKNAIMKAVTYASLTRDGVTETIYSNEISVDIDGEIAILNELR